MFFPKKYYHPLAKKSNVLRRLKKTLFFTIRPGPTVQRRR